MCGHFVDTVHPLHAVCNAVRQLGKGRAFGVLRVRVHAHGERMNDLSVVCFIHLGSLKYTRFGLLCQPAVIGEISQCRDARPLPIKAQMALVFRWHVRFAPEQ